MSTPQSRHRRDTQTYNTVRSGVIKVFTYLSGLGIIFVILEVVFAIGVELIILTLSIFGDMLIWIPITALMGFAIPVSKG